MERNNAGERDCFALAKDARIDEELQDLDRINRDRENRGLAPLTWPEYQPEIHRSNPR